MKVFMVLLLAAFALGATRKLQPNLLGINAEGCIIGGQQANAGQYPFLAAIDVNTNTSKFVCAGSLLGPQWILTAGQCVNGAISFNVALGSNTLEGTDGNRLILSTSEYVLHPEFNLNTLDHDIGLIKLRIAISYTEYISRIFMAYSILDEQTNLVAVGWGQTSDSLASLSNYLQYVGVAAISNLECMSVYGNQVNEGMVCVGGQYNEGICTGDSGGPLLHYEGSAVRHVGIASFFSGNGCENTNPSGYTRTLQYRDWITNVTGIIS